MKRIMLMGRVYCGKTTLCQRLAGEELVYKKTQSIEFMGETIDTPGEYAENRKLMRALTVSAVDADIVVFLESCTDQESCFSPGQASMFGCPVIGVVTKVDLAMDQNAVAEAKERLVLAGAGRVFLVSSTTGEGIEELVEYLHRD